MEETEKIIVKEQPAAFPFEAIASERQFFLTNCRMADRRIGQVAGIFKGENETIHKLALQVQAAIIDLYDKIDYFYSRNPQTNYDDMENSNGKTADLTRLYTFCLSLQSYADEYKEVCPDVTQHCYLAMASLIDAANAIAAFFGRGGEPKGMNTLGAYLGFAAFLSDPETLRSMAKNIIENQPKQL